MKKNLRIKTPEEVQKVLANAWLNIHVHDDNKLYNPLEHIPASLEDEPELFFMWILSRPEYFSFICSELLNIQLLPTQAMMLRELWNRKFPMLIASRGFGKSFILAVYALLRIFLMPKRKVVIAGAAFRQSKVIFEYMEAIWNNAPIFRDLCGQRSGPKREQDMFRFFIGESTAAALPIGDGSKIRGQRANDIMADEFASIPREVFENVIAGFAAVSSNPIENVQRMAAAALAERFNLELPEEYKEDDHKSNQIIISGTAYYDFNHFAEYWRDWREIIRTRGNKDKIAQFFNRKNEEKKLDAEDVPEDFDWSDYSIIRIPFELIPKGFMDAGQVARSKATVHAGIYLMEFGACFSKDSNGFFKRSLIESCVVKPEAPIETEEGPAMFKASLLGNPIGRHVIGVDPASERDNFSIIVLELRKGHRRIVHGWSTNKAEHKEKVKKGVIKETDYYAYCARKIRELMKRFPCVRVAMDSQGGGISIMEALQRPENLKEGEQRIWPVINPDKPADTDGEEGLHIVELINFASSDWTSEANHGLRFDFEQKVLLLPYFDGVEVGQAAFDDLKHGRTYDTLEDCVMEIEELKNELAQIIISQTPSGRDKWDTPEVKLPGGKKGRLTKDRYSALLMANMVARQLEALRESPLGVTDGGGFASRQGKSETSGPLYHGPAWFVDKINGVY